jgi:hypothetical protein
MQAAKDNTHIAPNGQASANDNQLYLLQPGGIKTPVVFDIFKYGGGVYLALVNHEKNVHIPLMANCATMKLELKGALYQIEMAMETNDQGHLSRKGRR